MIALYIVCYVILMNASIPIASGSPINYTLNRLTSLIFQMQEMCVLTTNASKAAYIPTLNNSLYRLQVVYYTVLLGNDAYKITGPGTELFPDVKKTALQDGHIVSELLFKDRDCLRSVQSTCPGSNWTYYQVAHSAIDGMISQLFTEANALIAEAGSNPTLVNLDSSHLNFAWEVGMNDLLDGLAYLSYRHEELVFTPFHQVETIHIILLLICVIGMTAYMFLLLFPLLRKIRKEAHRIAELLSQLPRELDITKVVVAAMSAASKRSRSGGRDGEEEGTSSLTTKLVARQKSVGSSFIDRGPIKHSYSNLSMNDA
uniref:Uncharacterized protein n=1 Tax=Polytomella parva TaxID=51329 RepID=A0A7S0VCJ6_9CHLO